MTATRSRTKPPPPARRAPVLAIVLGAIALVVVVGIAITVAGESEPTDDAPSYGPVTVEGQPLAPLPDSGTDTAVGAAAPIVSGLDPEGDPTTIGGTGEPTLVAFLAHYCPHCQAELPVLVDLQEDGTFDGVRTVAVLTGTNPEAPNYPPVSWLEREGWGGDVLLDDEQFTAAAAYGLTVYPYLVAIDADGNIVARASGELPPADLAAMATAARGEG